MTNMSERHLNIKQIINQRDNRFFKPEMEFGLSEAVLNSNGILEVNYNFEGSLGQSARIDLFGIGDRRRENREKVVAYKYKHLRDLSAKEDRERREADKAAEQLREFIRGATGPVKIDSIESRDGGIHVTVTNANDNVLFDDYFSADNKTGARNFALREASRITTYQTLQINDLLNSFANTHGVGSPQLQSICQDAYTLDEQKRQIIFKGDNHLISLANPHKDSGTRY